MQNDKVNSDVIKVPDFPPPGGMSYPLLEPYSECDHRTNPGAYYWRIINGMDKTITFLLQTDSNKLREDYPMWEQITLGPKGEFKIPQCDKTFPEHQTFSFSISGLNLGNATLWPKPNGNKSKQMPILILNSKGTIYLANRHATRRVRVRYQLAGQPEQNTDVDPNGYGPIGTDKDARIIDANYI